MVAGGFVSRHFVNKDGISFVTKPHTVNFSQKFNASRASVFLVLYHRRYVKGKDTGLGVAQLAAQSGISYAYIRAKAGKWTAWKFLQRKIGLLENGRPGFLYTLADRGRVFVEQRIPDVWRQYYLSRIKSNRTNEGTF